MTWNVQFSGNALDGPDQQEQYDYLRKVFASVMSQIKSEGITRVSSARLITNWAEYDFVAEKETSQVS